MRTSIGADDERNNVWLWTNKWGLKQNWIKKKKKRFLIDPLFRFDSFSCFDRSNDFFSWWWWWLLKSDMDYHVWILWAVFCWPRADNRIERPTRPEWNRVERTSRLELWWRLPHRPDRRLTEWYKQWRYRNVS